jgi:hypothetical protein
MLYQMELFTGIKKISTVHDIGDIRVSLRKCYDVRLGKIRITKIGDDANFSDNNDIIKNNPLAVATSKLRSVFSAFDCNFLRKEKLYTKLKYSRSPQYDIVSGGVAAIFSAFIGFLISEKFGIELVDSGDFYIVFMYCVFFSFSLRPLLRVNSKFDTTVSVFNLFFFTNLVTDLVRFILLKLVSVINLLFVFTKLSLMFLLY